MVSRDEQLRNLLDDLESPFLEGELFAGESEEEWEAHLAALEAESPFTKDLIQGARLAVEPEYEEEEEPSLEGEVPYAGEELEDYEEEEVEDFEWEVEEAPAEFEEAYEDEKPEDVEEEFETYEDEGLEEEALAIPYLSEEFSALSSEGGFEPDFEEVLPLLFDAELPATEEEVDEEGELPTDPADGWVIPQDVLRAGENQSVQYADAPNWDESRRSSICSGWLREGARILRRYLLDNFPGIREIGGYNCRPNSASPHKLSIHGTGRALDIMIPTINGRANNTVGDPIANWLVLNASAIGIQYLIWNRVRWSGGRRRRKFAPYTGPNPHRDHIHVELNLDGAQQRTPWFVGRAAPVETAAAKVIDYEKAIRLNRFYGVQLGWQQRLSEITRLLGLASKTPEERDFAEAVARWQREQGLKVDGILGPRTWAKMERALSTIPTTTPIPQAPPELRQRIKDIAIGEWKKWDKGRKKETNSDVTKYLREYFSIGVGREVSETDLQNPKWHKGHPWSAVFISYVMKKAGAGNAFKYSRLHAAYIAAAKDWLSMNDERRFWAYRITEAKPEIGDLVSKDRKILRNRKRVCADTTYDNVGERNKKGYLYRSSHSDIVVDIDRSKNRIRVIGGNVDNSVGAKWIDLDSAGYLPKRAKDGCEYIAILKPPVPHWNSSAKTYRGI